jgi:periplasmic protein TonB
MKLRYALYVACMYTATAAHAQDNKPAPRDPKTPPPGVFSYVEQMPTAGYDYQDFLNKTIHYPDSARVHNIEGRVIVKFVVNEDGSISDCSIARGVDSYIDAEALRVVRSFPRWKPGHQNGKLVKVYFTLPINFRLK